MSRLDELKQTFFEESGEQLEAIEGGLSDLRETIGSDDTIHAVFRAVHSIKGGAGVFGFERLVAFAHVLEAVLDGIRHGDLAETPDVIDALFSANDILSDLVESARSQVDLPANYEHEARAALERLSGDGAKGGVATLAMEENSASADFEEFDFTPVPAESFDAARDADDGDNEKPHLISESIVPELPVEHVPEAPAIWADDAEGARGPEQRVTGALKPTAIRVDLDRMDRVVNMVGELVIAQSMLRRAVENLPEEANVKLQKTIDEVNHHIRELKDSVMAMRAQPVWSVFQRMRRLVREVSARTGKKVELELSGESTEVDKTVVERLPDPLVHIIRNSIDHGIELPEQRLARGKSVFGTIRLLAEQRGGRIVIEVSDDGAGIDSERVLRRARANGLVDANAVLSEDQINNLIFLPGFSTVETVSDISGRGVGMDVVRRYVVDIGGRVTLKSVPGQGLTIQLSLPLTLAVMEGMVVEVGGEIYVLPISAIVECVKPTRADIDNQFGTPEILQLRGEAVQLAYLGVLLDIDAAIKLAFDGVVVIVESSDGFRLGLVVDEICGHQQVVIKSIEENYRSVPGLAAATILGDGSVAFILDIEKLPELARQIAVDADVRARNLAQSAVA